ncbi:MAG: DNA/RNA nuclease SfsA [Puniceicoccales bacterium]|nr:DNA/RNA nuclease SfsA [Puniceicoccales bacterium]
MIIPLHLSRGTLLNRPNRFVFIGKWRGKERRWHCPVTGSIGGVKDFSGVPCLVTPRTPGADRTTEGTVEAISLDDGRSWIGINQNRINGWVEQLLLANALPDLIPCSGAAVHHEVRVGNSRLDLAVEREGRTTYLEIKTPMHDLFLPGTDAYRHQPTYPQFFERLIRHYTTLGELAAAGHRTVVLLCFLYDAPPFVPPERNRWNGPTMDKIAVAGTAGVENWQLNLAISPRRLRSTQLHRLNLLASQNS